VHTLDRACAAHGRVRLSAAFLIATSIAAAPAALGGAPADDLGEVVVTATLRPVPAAALPASVTVLDADALTRAGTQHFEDVLGLVPNLNWSSGTARPRYFQLRGIGELEQYEGAPNPSVGFLIDDIDFSGLGSVATLYDLDRIEVLRGPQGTRYGASALGGLVYARSRAPEDRFDASAEILGGARSTRSTAAMLTGPVPALDSTFRLAVQRYQSDGPFWNAWLGRHTDARDELTARGRWHFAPAGPLAIDVAVLHGRIDDGFDAFAIDNSRTMQSDHPGVDRQHSTGGSVRATWSGWRSAELVAIATAADTVGTYSYDGDWGNPQLWAPYVYDFTYRADRDRRTRTLELRLTGGDPARLGFVVGAYAQRLDETLHERSNGTFAYPPGDPLAEFDVASDDVLDSRYRATSTAIYGQLDGRLASELEWSLGLRGERRTSRYADARRSFDVPTTTAAFRPSDSMAGGHASLTWHFARAGRLYALASRGYKAGGLNPSAELPESRRLFGPEALWNFELGLKAELLDGRLATSLAVFEMRRQHLQVRTGEQLVAGDPNTFVFFTGNAARGYNRGVEAGWRFAAGPHLELGGSFGLLRTRFQDFVLDGAVVPDREQPHAPRWQGAVDATLHDGPWYARLDLTGTGGFYFDVPPNDTRTGGWALVHLRAGWDGAHWSASTYVHNLADRRYPVRGFYFGNEPPDFPNKLYTQLGDPREWGVSLEYRYR
jgi:outer membrane receptor protein involved in Fe transport